MKETLVQTLANFAHNLSYKNIPTSAIEKAKDLIIDNIGTAYGGCRLETMRRVVDFVKNDIKSKGNTTIIAQEFKAHATDSAFANSAMIHSIGQEDTHDASFSHPGSVVIPAALAIGEQEGRSGIDVLTSIVLGYDVMGKIGKVTAPGVLERGFRPTSIFGPFGAASAAGKLLELDEQQMANALGYAANFSMGLNEVWNAGTDEWHIHAGMAARNGIVAALLAKKGMRAAGTVLEGPYGFLKAFGGQPINVDQIVSSLGKEFEILKVFSKAFPAAGVNQTPIQATIDMVRDYEINLANIDKIRVKVSEATVNYSGIVYYGPFTTLSQAMMSLPFAIVAAIMWKKISLDIFLSKRYADPKILESAKMVEVTGETNRKNMSIEIEILTRDGKVFKCERVGFRCPTRKEMIEKFVNYASTVLPKQRVAKIVELIIRIEDVENIRELMKYMAKDYRTLGQIL